MSKSCFIIMPFSETSDIHDESYWSDFFVTLKSIMEDNGYSCERSEVGPYKLFDKIVENIRNSDIVIAVLTDFNANVWYELGIRHTLRTGTIMLLQEGQKAPFDISDYGIIFYRETEKPTDADGKIRASISRYLGKITGRTVDSPVIRAIGRSHVRRILWVDDNPDKNRAVQNALTRKHIQVDTACATEKGLELYEQNLYDLIITDMGRGEKDDAGMDLLRELKSLQNHAPVIVYTSRSSIEKYGDQAKSLGAAVTNKRETLMSFISDKLKTRVSV